MSPPPPPSPNPRRVAAGKRNQLHRKGLRDASREKLRQTALTHQPWLRSTGPRTPAGKAQAVANGKVRQKGPVSVRELRAELAEIRSLVKGMRDLRLESDLASNHDLDDYE